MASRSRVWGCSFITVGSKLCSTSLASNSRIVSYSRGTPPRRRLLPQAAQRGTAPESCCGRACAGHFGEH
eukprot:2274507-Amphidinium_carterae.1